MISEGDYGEVPLKIKEIIKKILQSTERIIKLVNTILNISKIEAGEMEMNFERVDLREIPREAIEELKIKAKEKNLSLEFDEPKERIENLVDKEKIREVVLNLLDNAIKYTPDGGTIEISTFYDEKGVTLTVKDNGIGIPKEDLPRIFERFYRVDKARSRELGGTGLGLSIVKQIVELHKGNVKIDSELGKGTTVTVQVPYSKNS